MKKVLVVILCVCMLMAIAAGCAKDASKPSASASASGNSSASSTAEAQATETAGPILPSEDDLMLFDFENAEADVFAQQDLSNFNIPLSETAISDKNTDTGKGFQVLLDYNGGCWCQNFSAAMPEEFAQANEYAYVRIWVSNQGEGALSIGMILTGDGKQGSMNAGKAIVTRCDGEVLKTATDDSAGTGAQDHVQLPSGFSGWVAFPVAEEMLPYWSNPVIDDISKAESFNFDMRPAAPSGMEYYVLDDICLTDSASGVQREYNGPEVLTLEEVKKEVE